MILNVKQQNTSFFLNLKFANVRIDGCMYVPTISRTALRIFLTLQEVGYILRHLSEKRYPHRPRLGTMDGPRFCDVIIIVFILSFTISVCKRLVHNIFKIEPLQGKIWMLLVNPATFKAVKEMVQVGRLRCFNRLYREA